MWCNFSGTENFGFQPVKVFETEMVREFKNIRCALNSWFPSQNLDKIELKYQIGKYNLVGPYATSKSIHLSETFLSAFWNFSYGISLATPLGKTEKGDALKHYNPYNSLSYCRDLFENYKDWDTEKLPNPEFREKELIGVINGVNNIYSIGLYFIILHEFSHIIRGDIFQNNVSKSKYHEMEFACDTYALEVLAASTDLNDPTTIIGVLCAMGLISFSSTFEEKYTEKHPFPDERLENILNGFTKFSNTHKNHNIWTLATWILVSWDFLNNKIFPGMENSIFKFDDIGKFDIHEVFNITLGRLQDKKVWRKD